MRPYERNEGSHTRTCLKTDALAETKKGPGMPSQLYKFRFLGLFCLVSPAPAGFEVGYTDK